eukprot:PhM_4_TR9797/c4_g1_i3/m.63026
MGNRTPKKLFNFQHVRVPLLHRKKNSFIRMMFVSTDSLCGQKKYCSFRPSLRCDSLIPLRHEEERLAQQRAAERDVEGNALDPDAVLCVVLLHLRPLRAVAGPVRRAGLLHAARHRRKTHRRLVRLQLGVAVRRVVEGLAVGEQLRRDGAGGVRPPAQRRLRVTARRRGVVRRLLEAPGPQVVRAVAETGVADRRHAEVVAVVGILIFSRACDGVHLLLPALLPLDAPLLLGVVHKVFVCDVLVGVLPAVDDDLAVRLREVVCGARLAARHCERDARGDDAHEHPHPGAECEAVLVGPHAAPFEEGCVRVQYAVERYSQQEGAQQNGHEREQPAVGAATLAAELDVEGVEGHPQREVEDPQHEHGETLTRVTRAHVRPVPLCLGLGCPVLGRHRVDHLRGVRRLFRRITVVVVVVVDVGVLWRVRVLCCSRAWGRHRRVGTGVAGLRRIRRRGVELLLGLLPERWVHRVPVDPDCARRW